MLRLSIKIRGQTLLGTVDEIRDIDDDETERLDRIASGGFAYIRGWVLCTDPVSPVDRLSIAIGESTLVDAVLGLDRPDLGEAFGSNARTSGFCVAVPAAAPAGFAALTVVARTADREHSIRIEKALTIEPPPDPFAGFVPRLDTWEYAIDGLFIDGATLADVDAHGVFVIPPDRPARLRLWVVDGTSLRAPRAIVARCGGRVLPVSSGQSRADVARFLRAPAAENCGISVALAPGPVGSEDVVIHAVRDDGSYGHVMNVRIRQPDAFSSSDLPQRGNIVGALDELVVNGRPARDDDALHADAGQTIGLRGWAIDELGPRLAGGIELLIDDSVVASGYCSGLRRDIAALFGEQISHCEFQLEFHLPNLTPGAHALVVRALSARRDARADIFATALHV